MINKRIMNIIRILLEKDAYITIDMISHQLDVSNKTIRNDLSLVKDWLDEHDLTLIKKTGVGIAIEGDSPSKLKIMDIIQEKNNELLDYSPEARKIYIGMRLVSSLENCRIYELSNELYVSRATIHKDILSLTPLLENHKLQLLRKNNNGVSILGKERNKRNFLFDLMLRDNGYQTFLYILKQESYACDGSIVFAGLDLIDDEVNEFIRLLTQKNDSCLSSLSFQSLVQFLLRAYISYLRMQLQQNVSLSDNFLDEMKKEPFYEESKAICERMSQHFHVEFPEKEIRYLQVYLISLQNSSAYEEQDKEMAFLFTKEIIESWSSQLGLPFDQDQDLHDDLYADLCPGITRYRHGIPIQNPLNQEIQKLYKNTYAIAKTSVSCIEERFQCQLSEDEIGYFTLHLAAALEKMKQPLRTVLVCHGGVGASKLLIRKLSIQIPEIQIIASETFFSIYDFNLQDTDFILSTMELHLDTDLPILEINPLLYDFDVHRCKEVIKEVYKSKNTPVQSIEKEG